MSAAFRPRFRRGKADPADSSIEPVDDADQGVGRESGPMSPPSPANDADQGDRGALDDRGLQEEQPGGAGEGDGGEWVGAAQSSGVRAGGAGEGDGGEWLAYEFHEWSLESRVMLQQLLTVDRVVHSWQGTTLMVHESLEEKVDSLVEEAEEAEQASAATSRPLGPEDDLTAFEIGDWSPELREELVERLVQARVPYILEQSSAESGEVVDGRAGVDVVVDGGAESGEVVDGGVEVDGAENVVAEAGQVVDGVVDGGAESGEVVDGGGWDLWVRESDEARVDLVIEDLLARVEEEDFAELDGLEVNALLSDLFVACDRLRRDVRDPDGVSGALASAARITEVRTPFGFSTTDWRSLREASGALLDLMEGQHTDEDELRDLAQRLGDTLRTLI